MNTLAEASCHSYLGNRLTSAGRKHSVTIDSKTTYQVLIITLPEVVLFPGETIPLRLQDEVLAEKVDQIIRSVQTMGGGCIKDMQTVGVLTVTRSRNGRQMLSTIGTTLEIKSSHFAISSDSPSNQKELVLTAKGAHRFRVKNVRTDAQGIRYASANILDDSACVLSMDNPKRSHENAFPAWVYHLYSPVTLARRAFYLTEKCLFWNVSTSTQYFV